MAKLIKTIVKTGGKKVFAELSHFAERAKIDKEVRDEIGAFAVDRMQRTARSGKSIVTGKAFAKLAPATVKFRRSLAKYNQTHSLFKENRSNLTIIGDLIDSISYRIEKGKIDIRPRGTHEPYKTKPGKKRGGWDRGESVPNETIAKRLLDMGRVFIGIDETGRKRIDRIVSAWARKRLKLK